MEGLLEYATFPTASGEYLPWRQLFNTDTVKTETLRGKEHTTLSRKCRTDTITLHCWYQLKTHQIAAT